MQTPVSTAKTAECYGNCGEDKNLYPCKVLNPDSPVMPSHYSGFQNLYILQARLLVSVSTTQFRSEQ